MSRLTLVIAALLLVACGPTDAERVDADIRAWKAREVGAATAEVWVRRHCRRLFNWDSYDPRPCRLDDLTQSEEIAFMRWLAAQTKDGGTK